MGVWECRTPTRPYTHTSTPRRSALLDCAVCPGKLHIMTDGDFSGLRERLMREYVLGERSIHGAAHWARVEQIGLRLSETTGADRLVVRLFSLFHDCRRESDSLDPEHGPRGAERARQLCGTLFQLDDERLALLCRACEDHTDGKTSADPTIGTCWDADRLDLPRVGIIPDPKMLSTRAARDPKVILWATSLSRPEWRNGSGLA